MPAKTKSTGASSADAPSAAPAKKAATSRSAAPKAAEVSAATPPPPPKPAPGPTLDLLAEKPRRVRNRAAAAAAAAEPPPPPPPPPKEVLSLIDDEPKPKRRRPVDGAPTHVVTPISLIRTPARAEAPAPIVAAVPEVAPAEEQSSEPGDEKIICIKPPIIVRDLADRMGVKVFVLIKDLMELDFFANPGVSIEPDIAAKVCEKHGFTFEREKREKGAGVHKPDDVVLAPEPTPPEEEKVDQLVPRPPIIAFMGHVDHGKTSLVDAIRKSRVVSGEAGGITQHVGAYSVEHNGHPITVLDTPGHAAFSAMRARGANVTDIVVLVIAADDGVMPQTKEAIAHAKAADVKIIVALNKIDLKTADPDKVKMQLQEQGLMTEDWGGSIQCIPVSATKGTGITELLNAALLEAEMLELMSNPKAPCRALIIESRVEPGKGPSATVIPQTGTLRPGTAFICGALFGKVRSMLNDRGQSVKEAGPAMPVEVLGFSGMPGVGDELLEMDNEKDVKRISEERTAAERMEKLGGPRRANLEDLFNSVDGDQKKKLKLVLRTDVNGSLEAIVSQLRLIISEKVEIRFLMEGVGPITENDILLAAGSDAIIIGFGVKVESKALKVAKAQGVQIKLYSIIYELIDQVRDAMLGLLDPLSREKVVGHAQVKQVFKVSKGKIGGSIVTDGRITRSARARVLRGKQAVYDGGFHTLRRFTEDVLEVRNGLECGIRLGDFNDYEVGDIIECYELEKFAQGL